MDVVKDEIVQIKEVLKKSPRGINVIDIAKQVNMNRQTVTKYLEMLIVSGNVDVKTFGPSKVYYLSQRLPVSSMISLSSDFILLLDKDFNVVNVNDSFLEFTSTKKDDILGKGIDSIPFPMEFDPPIAPNINDALEGKESRIDAYYKKKGKEYFYSVKFIPIAFDDGRPGATVMFEDITERKKAEGALRESEARHKVAEAVEVERKRLFGVLETLPAMICLLTLDYKVAFANRSFIERFGESQGRHCYEYCFGRTEPCDFCESFNVLKTGNPHHWEVNAPDGSVIESHDYPFTDVDGTPMILEMDVDITQRKRIEEELKKANRAYQIMAKCKEAMIHAEDETALMDKICRIIVDVGGYPLAWIGYIEDDDARTVRPVAWAGVNSGYVENLRIYLNDPVRGNGPTGECLKTGKPVSIGDVRSDPRMAPWREAALTRGFISTLNIPLVYEKHVIGNITTYSPEANAFNEKELELMFELAGNLAYGITTLRDRSKRLLAEDGLRRSHDELDSRVKERTKELMESEANLARAQQMSRIGSWTWDIMTDKVEWSDQSYRNYGLTPGEVTPTYDLFLSFIVPEDRERVDNEVRNAIEAGSKYNVIYGIIRNDGVRRVLLSENEVITDSSGKVVNMYGTNQDITERKHAEDELREKQKKIAVLAEELEAQMEELRTNNEELETQIIERKRAEEEIKRSEVDQKNLNLQLKESNEQLKAILKVTESAMSTLEIEKLLGLLLDHIVKAMKCNASVILLKEGNLVQVRASTGIRYDILPGFSESVGQGFAGTIVQSGNPQYIEGAKTDSQIDYPPFKEAGISSVLGVPVRGRSEVIGVIHVDWVNIHPYNRQEQDFLQIIADHCGIAIENAKLYQICMSQNEKL